MVQRLTVQQQRNWLSHEGKRAPGVSDALLHLSDSGTDLRALAEAQPAR
jgi:hypothetical protein